METRQRGARQREAESRVSAEGQNTSATASNPPSTSRDSLADAASNDSKRGSLLRDGISIPRRGAKVTKAVSIASIPTRKGNESEDEEDDDDEEESRSQASHGSAPQYGDGSEANEDDIRQDMIAGLPDLARAADELMARLLNGDYGDKAFRAILNVKKRAFIHHLESCLQPDASSPFVSWATEMEKSAANVFARANLVSALDYIQNARSGGDVDVFNLLEALDSAIPTLFTPPGRGRPPPKMAVNVRACYAIELLAMSNNKTNFPRIIASVFCESTDNADFARIIANGPFRSLGDPREIEDSNLCSTTAYVLFTDGRRSGVDHLREKFSLDEVLKGLEDWIRREYPILQSGVTEEFEGSTSTSNPESQPIVRAGDTEKVPTLFVNTQSFRRLEATKSHSNAPPSNRQQAARNPTLHAPADRQLHSSRQLLLANPPIPDAVANTAGSGAKRANVIAVDDNEEEANSEASSSFETDDRPVDNTKRATIQSGLPASKRLRPSSPEPQPSSSQRIFINPSQTRVAPFSSAPAAQISSQRTFINPSTARAAPSSSAPAGRMSSQIDLGAIKRKTADASDVARIQQRGYRGGPQTRMPWSENDTVLLIELVCETNASWAIIQKNHNDKFEYPRNQQAYRDKARNLKVEFLSSDAVLPPGFDHVALGPKEVIKVREKGKNHMRLELDIDSRGNPIKTVAYA